MQKFLKINLPLLFLLLFIAFVNSIPTSVLVNTKDVKLNSKVKRSSNTNLSPSSSLSGPGIPAAGSTSLSSHHHKSDLDTHSTSSRDASTSVTNNNNNNKEGRKVTAESLFGANQGLLSSSGATEPKSTPQKRGINSQLSYSDLFNNGAPSGIGSGRSSYVAFPSSGIWTEEIDPSILYQDLQDFDDYPRGSYKAKPYDNLQSILNAEMYSEPVALPLQYPYRYYGDRKKRSNKKNNNAAALASGIPSSYDMRLKRESKLTPADMLALVALVEAGERSRQEAAENDDNLSTSTSLNNDYSRSYFNPYETQTDDGDYYGNGNSGAGSSSWIDPAIDYYGMPYNLESLPRYDVLKDQKLNSNYYPSKRYMITKKKRSLGHFLNEPINYPSLTYDNRFSSSDLYGKSGPKRYQKYF